MGAHLAVFEMWCREAKTLEVNQPTCGHDPVMSGGHSCPSPLTLGLIFGALAPFDKGKKADKSVRSTHGLSYRPVRYGLRLLNGASHQDVFQPTFAKLTYPLRFGDDPKREPETGINE
jgi:hypothetical protein